MNIFYISHDPKKCAQWAVDKHVVKMILESAQLLSTSHRLIDGIEYTAKTKTGRNVKRWSLNDSRDNILYTATHINHPSAVWCRQNVNNYYWLSCYLMEHCEEYTYRYGKIHKVESSGLLECLKTSPHAISKAAFFDPPAAMDTKYIISNDSVINYRNYYKQGKSHLHAWKNREPPEWIKEN